jgi:ABC-type branched-subunit amino acid transport system substrate-binding protein
VADSKSVDFYSGALLAARDLGNKGIRMDINAYDIAGDKLNYYMVNNADVVLGPVSEADVMAAARMATAGRYIISPLEPRTAGMADTLRMVQAPTPARTQAEDAVRWAVSDMVPGDCLVLIREKDKLPGETAQALIKALQESGQPFSTISYDLLDGLQIQPVFVEKSSPEGTTRYLIASDEESFVNDAVRNINLMAYKKQAVALYGPSRLRSYATIETENLHNVCSHISTTYQTDYMSPSVQAFIMAYRALYGAEPNQFAFHGYDCLTYFVTMCSRYGRDWFHRLPAESGRGLQTDFSFGLAPRAGQVNQAVRRVIYTPDFETVLQ